MSQRPSARSGERLLEAKGLVKAYGGRRVVDGVQFHVGAGEIVGLLGPNGAGKTTSFRMTVGLVKPDAGEIRLSGQDCAKLPMYKRARLGMGYLPQEASVFRRMSVIDNLIAVLETMPMTRAERLADAHKLLEELELSHLSEHIADIRDVISYLKKRDIGILITDHNVRETLDIIDRASIIHAGEVLFEGSPDEIVDDPEVRRVYLGDRFS